MSGDPYEYRPGPPPIPPVGRGNGRNPRRCWC